MWKSRQSNDSEGTKLVPSGDIGVAADENTSRLFGVRPTRGSAAARLPLGKCGILMHPVVLAGLMTTFIFFSSTPVCWGDADKLQTAPMARYAGQHNGKPLVIGFYVDWDFHSYVSLKNHLQSLDWVVPSWLYLRGETMDLKTSLNRDVLDLIRTEKPEMRVLAMIQNAAAGVWDGIHLARFLASPILRRERIKEIASFIESYHLQGIVIDFEEIQDAAQKDMINFVREVQATFKEKGWLVSVAVPFDDPSYDYAAYAKACDYLILMGYDEHWSTGNPGPIASHNWFSTRITKRVRDVAPSQTVIAIGNYGYDWTDGITGAQALTYPEIMQRAQEMKATVEFDAASLNPTYSYRFDDKAHQVWLLNSESAHYQLQTAGSYRPAGYALWRLGGEDPAIWSELPHAFDGSSPLSAVKEMKDLRPYGNP
jgi:peptidoglycan-N-acetylglucosamine deacetylase